MAHILHQCCLASVLLVTLIGNTSGFVPPFSQTRVSSCHSRVEVASFHKPLIVRNANNINPTEDDDQPNPTSNVDPLTRMSTTSNDDEDKEDSNSAIAGIAGVSGLAAAGGATVASTVVTTAGGVCAGGACVAGAGAVAAAGGSTAAAATAAGTTTAAVAGGGVLAGMKAMLLGGAIAAGVTLNGLSGGTTATTLEDMVRVSTPLESFLAEGGNNHRPTVMEFYGNRCPRCHDAASRLFAVEESAMKKDGFNWIMVNTDDPRMQPLWKAYRVDELPHFEFLDSEGREVAYEFGTVDTHRIQDRIAQAAATTVVQES
eukprot:CAMPEP_0195519228 /NCGR_PEP_ID=MMETSP0794_2-20130614/14528_1 /TAXON_ID=515487 /ORGANISM="Stephanopyxis turris, Strain CCMP 815" /LENGTH=315 /DNA_ID=CAMNT_0040648351 /DNA_START=25 /DNA_END=972 /DNA_ORIENTATION=-